MPPSQPPPALEFDLTDSISNSPQFVTCRPIGGQARPDPDQFAFALDEIASRPPIDYVPSTDLQNQPNPIHYSPIKCLLWSRGRRQRQDRNFETPMSSTPLSLCGCVSSVGQIQILNRASLGLVSRRKWRDLGLRRGI